MTTLRKSGEGWLPWATRNSDPSGRAKTRALLLARRLLTAATDNADIILGNVTINEDGLATTHAADFLDDARFVRSYALGKATSSWRDADIRWRCYVCCWAAAYASHLEGDYVECGVYRGGYARALIEYVDFSKLGKRMFLLNTFEGFVDEYIGEEDRARGRHAGGYGETYDAVVRTFHGLPVEVIRGAVPDTLPLVPSEKVAYVSVDMNCTPPEVAAMEFFWPELVPGGVVVHDDYGHPGHEPQRKALDHFAHEHGVEVLIMPTGQELLFKPPVLDGARLI